MTQTPRFSNYLQVWADAERTIEQSRDLLDTEYEVRNKALESALEAFLNKDVYPDLCVHTACWIVGKIVNAIPEMEP